jgi:chromosome segregation ATPase
MNLEALRRLINNTAQFPFAGEDTNIQGISSDLNQIVFTVDDSLRELEHKEELEHMDEQIKGLESQLEERRDEIHNLQDHLKNANKQLDTIKVNEKDSVADLLAEFGYLKETNEKLANSYRLITQERDRFQRELELLRKRKGVVPYIILHSNEILSLLNRIAKNQVDPISADDAKRILDNIKVK